MSIKTDWDRGYEAGQAQGRVDANARERELEQQVEKAKRANSRSQIKAQLTQAQAEIARLDKRVRDGMTVNAVLARELEAARAKLKEATDG